MTSFSTGGRLRPGDRGAILSALLLVGAAPPSPIPLLVFGALAPLLAVLARLESGAPGRREAFRAGVIHGGVAWALLLLWMPQAALRTGSWLVVGWVAVVATLALLGGVAAVLVHHLNGRKGVGLPLAAAVGWGAVEWIRSAALGPLDFPWEGLALPLAGSPPLIQGAASVGEIGLAVAVAACNGVVAGVLLTPRRSLGRLAGVVAAVVVVYAAGVWRIARTPTVPTLQALLIQPAVPLAVKRGDPDEALRRSVEAVEEVLPPPAPPVAPPVGGDVVVLPETALPVALDGPEGSEVRTRVAGWARQMGAPILVGAIAEGTGRGFNALFLADGDPTAPWPLYRKQRLVPGVEWIPGGESMARGATPVVLRLDDGRGIGPLICIESAGPEPARTLVREGAEVLVNVTNDSWLGEAPWWTRSAAWFQHPAHLAFRTVETGVGALRVGNNGSTEVVDPFGRRTQVVPPHVAGEATVHVERLASPAPFNRTGPVAGWAAVVLAVLLAGLPPRRRPDPVDPDGWF